jgi:hypothetical protein
MAPHLRIYHRIATGKERVDRSYKQFPLRFLKGKAKELSPSFFYCLISSNHATSAKSRGDMIFHAMITIRMTTKETGPDRAGC